jgi:hypothetical protein
MRERMRRRISGWGLGTEESRLARQRLGLLTGDDVQPNMVFQF